MLDGICKEVTLSRDSQLELKAYYQEINTRMDQYRSFGNSIDPMQALLTMCFRRT